jgi:hypothetical protein
MDKWSETCYAVVKNAYPTLISPAAHLGVREVGHQSVAKVCFTIKLQVKPVPRDWTTLKPFVNELHVSQSRA